MLKDKILELVSRPNCYKVIFEHESYGMYFCACYIDNGKIMYKGVGKDDDSAFEIANKKRLKFQTLSISLDELRYKSYTTAESIYKNGFRVTIVLDKDLKRMIIRDIDAIDEDEFFIFEEPLPLKDFCLDNHIELIPQNNTIALYRYTTKMCGPLCGSGGFIKVDMLTKKVIASKMEWIS